MYAEASAARKATTRATSSGWPMRRVGIVASNDAITFRGHGRRHLGLNQPRRHGIDGEPNAVAGQLVRLGQRERRLAGERLRKPEQPGLRGGVIGLADVRRSTRQAGVSTRCRACRAPRSPRPARSQWPGPPTLPWWIVAPAPPFWIERRNSSARAKSEENPAATAVPRRASRVEMAAPIPRVPPVTSATGPASESSS